MAGVGAAVRGIFALRNVRLGVGVLLLLLAVAGALEPARAQTTTAPSPSPGPAPPGNRTCDANASCAPRTPYHFELTNETLDQNLTLREADSVRVRDSRIFGDLVIDVADAVELQDVFIKGSLRVTDARNVTMRDLVVAGEVRLERVGPLRLASSMVGRDLTCRICADGELSDLIAGGRLRFDDLWNVTQLNVRSTAVRLSTPALPVPTAGQVKLEVANRSLAFAHERALEAPLPEAVGRVEVRLDVDPAAASARLRLVNGTGPVAETPRVDTGFEKLLEFEDRNGDNQFDLGDPVLREIRIPELRPRAVQQQRLGVGDEGWRSRLEFDVGGGGVLALVFTTHDGSSDRTKIDVEIVRYPYASPTSRLSMQVRLASDKAWSYEPGDAEDRIRFAGGHVDGYFSWVRQALADGENSTVRVRLLDERNDLGERSAVVLLMSYERADRIEHDPTIGVLAAASVELGPGLLGDRVVYVGALAGSLVLLWALGRAPRRAKP